MPLFSHFSSGLVQVPDRAVAPLVAQQTPTLVAEWSAPPGDPRPMEVGLSTSWPGNTTASGSTPGFPPPIAAFYAGGEFGATLWECLNGGNGAFIIRYGKGGISRTVISDLRSQRLYLGACTDVRVSAFRWRSAGVTVLPDLNVGADIGPAGGGSYDEPTITALANFVAAAAVSRAAIVPTGARWWTPLVGRQGGAFWGGTDPDLIWRSDCQAFVASAANYRWVPPLARFEFLGSGSTDAITVSSSGTVLVNALDLGVRFYCVT